MPYLVSVIIRLATLELFIFIHGFGRLMFLVYEIVTRRRINPKIETMAYRAGITALGVVMLVALYIDIRRMFT